MVPPEIQKVLVTGIPKKNEEYGACIELGPQAVLRYFWEIISQVKDKSLGDADISDLDKLPKNKIKELGGEDYTQKAKKNTGKIKSDLYWDKEGNVYSVPKKGGVPQWIDWIPRD